MDSSCERCRGLQRPRNGGASPSSSAATPGCLANASSKTSSTPFSTIQSFSFSTDLDEEGERSHAANVRASTSFPGTFDLHIAHSDARQASEPMIAEALQKLLKDRAGAGEKGSSLLVGNFRSRVDAE